MFFEKLSKLRDIRGRQFIDAVDNDGVGFLQLFPKDVCRLRRETGAWLIAQDAQAMARLEQHGVGRHLKLLPVDILERLHDRGHQVGTASHRFGENDIGSLVVL